MKSYKIFIGVSIAILVLFVVFEINRPKKTNWSFTLSNTDKNPFGTYVLFNEIKNVFPFSKIKSYREPAYNLLHENEDTNTAYVCITNNFPVGKYDLREIINYVKRGNYFFIAAYQFSKLMLDTMGFNTGFLYFGNTNLNFQTVNFENPTLKVSKPYTTSTNLLPFYRSSGFAKLIKQDSIIALGSNSDSQINFIKIPLGKGAFFIHSDPLCFSNYFVLKNNNAEYSAKALSYIPSDVSSIMWDEYYKLGRTGATTPLRFLLSNNALRWAFWIALIAIFLFMLFESKRKQRIIPVIEPLRNSSLDFTKTIANVYFEEKNNNIIGTKKIQHWLEFVRSKFFLATNELDENFINVLSRKSGVDESIIKAILNYSRKIEENISRLNDEELLELNTLIDSFYNSAK